MPSDECELGAGLGQFKAWLQASQHVQKPCSAILHSRVGVFALLQWSKDVRISIQLEACGSNPDDGRWFALINERIADGAGCTAKVALPQSIADHRDRRCARPVFVRRKCAAL